MSLITWLTWFACGSTEDADAVVVPREEVCTAVGEATCRRALQCNKSYTALDTCTSAFVGNCCTDDGTCDQDEDQDRWDACEVDIEELECSAFGSKDGVPPSCAGLYE